MKSARMIFLSSIACGVMLFAIGIFLLINIKAAQPQPDDIHLPTTNSNSGTIDLINDYTGSGNPINFLILIKEASGLNTDTMIIANYNPVTKQINLLTVPRDTKPSNSANYKLNSTYSLGIKKYERSKDLSTSQQKHKAAEYTAQEISNLLNVPIDYYVYMEIDTIKEIVNKLGGVYFDVPADLRYTDPSQDLYINLKKGYQLLDGDKTEQLLRFRKSDSRASSEWKKYYDGSDLKRTEMQIKFIKALVDQKVNLLQLPNLIPVISYTFDNVITNTSLSDTLSLFRAFTQASRPEMNTFKLYGLDRRINGADFFIYINQVEDTKTRDRYDSPEIFEKYFASRSSVFVPENGNKYDFQTILRDNPSNAETGLTGDNQDKP